MIILLVTLITSGISFFFSFQARREKKRADYEENVMKGYFLLGLSGLMAKVAIADGKVTDDEAEMASRFFNGMQLTDAERALCLGNFIKARRDGLDARDHAKRFIAYANTTACEFLYDLLWKISKADGVLDASEDKLLADIATYLGLGAGKYEDFKAGKTMQYDRGNLESAGVPPSLLALVP